MILHLLVNAVALFIFGALWYTVIFGKMWTKLMGFSEEDMAQAKKEGMAGKMFIMFVMNLLTVTVVTYLLPQLLALSFEGFFKSLFIIWLGFSLPLLLGPYLWERKSWKLILLNAIYGVISLKIVAALVYFW